MLGDAGLLPEAWIRLKRYFDPFYAAKAAIAEAACGEVSYRNKTWIVAKRTFPQEVDAEVDTPLPASQCAKPEVSIMNNSVISIDLAKNVFQICVMTHDQKITTNKKGKT